MQHAQLSLDAPVIAGETVEMVNKGFFRERGGAALGCGEILEIIDSIKAKVMNRDTIHEDVFLLRARLVMLVEGGADFFVDLCFS